MKFYVAGSYAHRFEIDRLVDAIKQQVPEFECTSTWLLQGEEDAEISNLGHQHFIDLDFRDVARADAILLINDPILSVDSTGKWVELGIAMEQRKLVVVWGWAQKSLFTHDRFTVHVDSVSRQDLIEALKAIVVTHRWSERKDEDEDDLRKVTLHAHRERPNPFVGIADYDPFTDPAGRPGDAPVDGSHEAPSEDGSPRLPFPEGDSDRGPSGGLIHRDKGASPGEARPGESDPTDGLF